MVFMFIVVGGCSSLETSCLDLASTGKWTKIESSDQQQIKRFDNIHERKDTDSILFRNEVGETALCVSCGAGKKDAGVFIVDATSSGQELITSRTCGPY